MTSPTTAKPSGRLFLAVWAGQLISLASTALTAFVLGVWVLRTTGSVTQYAVISVFTIAAAIVVTPFIGLAADRLGRRGMLLASNTTACAVAAAIAVIDTLGELRIWHVYVAAALVSVCTSTHFVVTQALVPLLVPREHHGRATGLLQMVPGIQIAAPVAGAALFGAVGIRGVAALEVVATLLAVVNLLRVELPRSDSTGDPSEGPEKPSLARDLGAAVRYLRERPALLLYVALVVVVVPFFFGLAGLLVQPLILSFGSFGALSALMFAGGVGFLLGSLVMSVWGGPRTKIHGVWGGLLVGGVVLAAHSLAPSVWLILVVAPLFLFLVPILTGCSQTIMIRKTEAGLIGRMVATNRTVGQVATGLAYVVAGPLTDRVFEPAMRPAGALADSVGALIGVGAGRGIATIYLISGAVFVVVGIAGYATKRLRRLEIDLPDAWQRPAPEPDASRARETAATGKAEA